MQKLNRLKSIPIDCERFLEFLREHTHDIPPDAGAVCFALAPGNPRRCFLTIASDTFREINRGELVPELFVKAHNNEPIE